MHEEWLENLVTPFLNNVKTGIVYGKQIGNEKTKFSEHQVFKKWFPSGSINSQNSYFCNNANCATKKELWEKIKYDEELTGLEDLKYAKKVKQENYEICYRADAAIVHVHEENFSQTLNRYRREAIAMKEIEKDFSYGLITFLKGICISMFNDWWVAIKEEKFFKEFLNIVKFRYAQCYGTYKGFNSSKVIENEIYEKFYGYENNPSAKVEKEKLTKINYENKISCMIPMRHNSERVPGKNYRKFGDKPLFMHILETIHELEVVDEILINTDSPEIEKISGASFKKLKIIPRPKNLMMGRYQ